MLPIVLVVRLVHGGHVVGLFTFERLPAALPALLLQRPASVAHPVPLPDALPFAIVHRIAVALPLQAIEEIEGIAVQRARERGNSDGTAERCGIIAAGQDVGGGRELTS